MTPDQIDKIYTKTDTM